MAGRNYLALVQKLALECGVPTSKITTVVGQSGESARLCGWIADAWNDIGILHEDWLFLEKDFSFATTATKPTYDPAADASLSDFGSWKNDSFRIYTTAMAFADEQIAPFVEYATWRDLYQYGQMRTTYSRPVMTTVTPEKYLGLGPLPDAVGYTVVGKYFRIPNVLAADSDATLLPAKYDLLPVYKAMMSYGAYEAAPEVYSRGEKAYSEMLGKLIIEQLPGITFGAALA